MFIDEVKLKIKAGHGGAGSVSFRREIYVPRGGPDGGDGGKGGDVTFVADQGESTLLKFRYKKEFAAETGGHGMGQDRHGNDGGSLILPVPLGTMFKDAETGEVLADLTDHGQQWIAGKGGIGGKGNAFFKSATFQAPRFAQPGMPGEEKSLHLELKLLADVGIIGLPNAGKSTLISRLTAAKPKIADYPFTTLSPKIGVVKSDDYSFVMADMPGLIEGAHLGKGLGVQFLKHIERTSVLCHLVDVSDPDMDRIMHDFTVVEREIEAFDPALIAKRQVVVLTKIDAVHEREPLEKLREMFEKRGFATFAISAVSGENLPPLARHLGVVVKQTRAARVEASSVPSDR